MSHYGISAIRRNPQDGEIAEVCLHEVVQLREQAFELRPGALKPYHEVANLIGGGDKVWVVKIDAAGEYQRVGIVGVKSGQHEYLFSHDKDGKQTSVLTDLPTF
jgi:hypothetical protein